MGRFPSLMCRFPALMGPFTDFVLRGRFTSWKSTGKQPIKKRGIKRFLIHSWLILNYKCNNLGPQGSHEMFSDPSFRGKKRTFRTERVSSPQGNLSLTRKSFLRKRGGALKSMGHKVPWKIGMLTWHPVTSWPLIFPQKEIAMCFLTVSSRPCLETNPQSTLRTPFAGHCLGALWGGKPCPAELSEGVNRVLRTLSGDPPLPVLQTPSVGHCLDTHGIVLSPCNLVTTHLTACTLKFYLPWISRPMKWRTLSQRPRCRPHSSLISDDFLSN